jgi:hypothetical protein
MAMKRTKVMHIRQDFPGGWEGDENNAFTKEGRTATQNEYFDFTCSIGAKQSSIHLENDALHSRTMCTPILDTINNETVMVINNSNETKNNKTDSFKENIKNFKTGKDELTFDVTNE